MKDDFRLETLGKALHFVQDWVAHRDPDGQPYNAWEGHGVETGFLYIGHAFDPDMTRGDFGWGYRELQTQRVATAVSAPTILLESFASDCGPSGDDGKLSEGGQARPVDESTGAPGPKGATSGCPGQLEADPEPADDGPGAESPPPPPGPTSGGYGVLSGRGSRTSSP